MNDLEKLYVTKPSLPDINQVTPLLSEVWKTGILTNDGPFCKQLESALTNHLGVKFLSLFNNGTIALLVALQSLKLSGEVITTPYSFVATSNAIVWNGLKPVFVDIKEDDFNIDPEAVEAAITDETCAILAVHVYGNPCNNAALQKIAKKHDLKLVYDAAHSFQVKENGRSILNYGDLSILSFHATKVFNTVEGGAIICSCINGKSTVDSLKNFGIQDEVSVNEIGINGKLNEISAIIGLLNLNSIDDEISKRKKVHEQYLINLQDTVGIILPSYDNAVDANYSYFPIRVTQKSKLSRDELYHHLKGLGIFSRRYFYPLIPDFKAYQETSKEQKSLLPVARKISNEILCLPIHSTLSSKDVHKISRAISEVLK